MTPRLRSPNYPAISLPDAVSVAGKLYSAIKRAPAARGVLAQILGYSGLSGTAIAQISALAKYGLLDETRGEVLSLTELAEIILTSQNEQQKHAMLTGAAVNPPLYRDIVARFNTVAPEESQLTAFLLERGYRPEALQRLLSAYWDTMKYAYGSKFREPSAPPVMDPTPAQKLGQDATITINGGKIEVSGILTSQEAVDTLIKALQATKALLP